MTPDTTDQAYVFFVQESLELLQILEQGLMTLSQEHDLPKLHNLMRAAHSIKGGAACVGLDGIQQIAHELENGIRALYPGGTTVDLELEELLLKGFDCLRSPLIEQIETGQCNEAAALAQAKPIFSQMETKIGRPLEEAAELPEVPMQTDMTLFLFQEEVPSGLRRLESLIHLTPRPASFITALKSQVEVLGTLGTMLNLTGFSDIADTALKAIQVNPRYAVKIAKLAVVDFWVGQQAVLSGDRVRGGQPGKVLLKLTKPQKRSQPPQESSTAALSLTPIVLPSVHPSLLLSPVQTSEAQANTSQTNTSQAIKAPTISLEPSTITIAPTLPQQSSSEPVAQPGNASIKLGVRVDLSRLEQINTLVGELTTQDNSFLLYDQQNKASLETLNKTWDKFRKLIVQLQGLTDMADPILQLNESLNRSSARHSTRSTPFLNQTKLSPSLLKKTLEDTEQIEQILYEMRLLSLQNQQLLKKRQQTLQQVQKQLTETRMVAVSVLLDRFPRMVRDLSLQKQKQVELELIGQNTLIDKVVLEKLYDPLVHLVRNAFDHGIEPATVRREQGKSEVGKIQLKAYHRGNYTYLEIQDDGRGINLKKVRQKAVSQGLISHAQAQKLSKSQLYELLFVPGFSTTETVSDLSGRGAGLDAVRYQIESLKGTISLQSESGKGTLFVLRLPWMLTVTKLLIFQVSERLFAIPMDTLSTIISISTQDIEFESDQEVYRWLGQPVPLVQSLLLNYRYPGSMTKVSNPQAATTKLGHSLSSSTTSLDTGTENTHPQNSKTQKINPLKQASPQDSQQASQQVMVLLLSKDLETVGLRIDQIVMEQNLAIKPFSQTLTSPPYFYGCTTLGDGRLVPVIDSPRLLETWMQQKQINNDEKLLLIPQHIRLDPQLKPTILVIDDSLTTRQSLSATLNNSGYHVIQAKHGREGLKQLQQHPEVQLVICDLEMPEMNGFEFLSHCRRQFSREKLPVLMVTSRNSDRYRHLAKQLGSNGYVTKPWEKYNLLGLLRNSLNQDHQTPDH